MTIKELLNIEKIKEVVKNRTKIHFGEKPTKEVSEKGKRIQEFVKCCGGSSSYKNELLGVASIILGETLSIGVCGGSYKAGVIIVMEKSAKSHNYPLGEPVMMVGGGSSAGLRINGTYGNIIPLSCGDIYRSATDKEIDEFFDKFSYGCGMSHLLNIIQRIGCILK